MLDQFRLRVGSFLEAGIERLRVVVSHPRRTTPTSLDPEVGAEEAVVR